MAEIARMAGERSAGAGTPPILTERVRLLRERAASFRRSGEPISTGPIPAEPRELAGAVDGVLDEIERLAGAVAGVGDDIVHELRTPLTRTRAILERGRDTARSLEVLQTAVDRAIGGLDRAIAIITALLRIAEIEHPRQVAGFDEMPLAGIVGEVAELFQPIAEDRDVALHVGVGVGIGVGIDGEIAGEVDGAAPPRGDRDLLFEAVANLVDNAIKFTPAGGRVELALIRRADAWVIRVADTGPGIPAAEREAVTRRFYRGGNSRNTLGLGLGLTLVAAIAKLHGFPLSIGGGPGCVVELVCARAASTPP